MRLVLLPIVLASAAIAWPRQEAPRVFPAQVELVSVELIVVDSDGRPVTDLRPEEFRVEVAGRPRRVVTADFLEVGQAPEEPAPAADPGFSTNQTVRPGRLVLLVVDTGNIALGKGRLAMEAAGHVLDLLGPADRVGLLTIPTSGPREEFTTDHERIRSALGKLVGQTRMTHRRLSLAEALSCSSALAADLRKQICEAAIDRECSDERTADDRFACGIELETEAWQIANEYLRASSDTIAVLGSAFDGLRKIEARKVVIVVSSGLGFTPETQGTDLRKLASQASAARVALYAVPADAGAGSAMDSDISMQATAEDRNLHSWGLESLAVETGGAYLRGRTEPALERVLRETSGYYRLGFEPEGNDRDGKTRKIKVSVTRKGLLVRARPTAVFALPESPKAAKDDLVAALRSPTLATGLPLRVTTWSLPGSEPGKLKLLIGAEIDRSAETTGLGVGYVLLDAQGKVAASASQEMRALAQTSGPVPYAASASVAPGPYTLRLAVRDGRGRLGSVDHHLEAGLLRVGGLALSDLLLGPRPEPGASFRPAVVPDLAGGALLVHGELTGTEEALAAASASFELVSGETGASVRTAPARLAPAGVPGRRVVQALVPLQGLPPGPYLARVVVAEGGLPRGAAVRPFRIVPR